MAKVKSRYDVGAIGYMSMEYVPMRDWENDLMAGAIKPLDATALEMETKWGSDRLQELVKPETAAKFEAAKAKLDVAIMDNDVQLVIKRAGILQRGWVAMDKEAQELGHKPAPPDVWFCHAPAEDGCDEFKIAIAKNGADASMLDVDVPVFTLQEVARIIRAWRGQMFAHDVKKLFPNAEVAKIDGEDIFNDEIPF